MNNKIDLSIIIVNHNTTELLLMCLKSIRANLDSIKYEVIVVDNSNHKDEVRKLKDAFLSKTGVRIVQCDNKGFGHANNQGSKVARGKYLLFLNPDTTIIDNSLVEMLGFLKKNPEIGVLSPLIYQPNKKSLQHHFYGYFQSFKSIIVGKLMRDQTDRSMIFIESEMISAACLLIKKEIFDQINGFDEHFFMYLEDDDLCRRISALGYINGVFPPAKIIHLEGKSSNSHQKKLMYYKSQEYYWKKHHGVIKTILMKIIRWPYKTLKSL